MPAIRALRRAVRDGAGAGAVRLRPPYLLANLAYACEAAADLTGTRRTVATATRAYRAACADALHGRPEIALTAARRWGACAARRWGACAARRRAWAEAAQAYDLALTPRSSSGRPGPGGPTKEIWLGAAQGVPDVRAMIAGRPHRRAWSSSAAAPHPPYGPDELTSGNGSRT